MSRLPRLRPDELDAEQRALYDAIAGGPRARQGSAFPLVADDGGLNGPFNAMLLQPGLGQALQALGSAIRYRTSLPVRDREIATLTVARIWDSAFERYAHEAVARAAGMTEAEIAALRAGDPDAFADPRERLVLTTTTALAGDNDLTEDDYDAAVAGLGLPALFELTTLVGYYATLARQLRVFRVTTPDTSASRPDTSATRP
jgi:4-carboxymuconolactone decarboxylase